MAFLMAIKVGPLRDLAMKGVDGMKTGRGPATVKTLACTMAVILASSVYSLLRIQGRGARLGGNVSPMDQVLWRTHLLEASLIGYTLFLAILIDRLHHYLKKLILLRKTVATSREETERLQNENRTLRESEGKASAELKKIQTELATFNEKLQKVKNESLEHERRAVIAEAHVAALQKQSEELLLEYDRVLEDNQMLQAQVLSCRE
ncbi:B-cell receptor-associated protein 31 [Rhynchospora pubera]|uniref:Endoplasmic reticulum transmembrane protein n=1 Tax=Rhynchospora pubera TaxID=906938 RepID=A0AAV8GX88_9POAL|nr:B-cell receptor-associated protein 31 [Rhynchospora pubera]